MLYTARDVVEHRLFKLCSTTSRAVIYTLNDLDLNTCFYQMPFGKISTYVLRTGGVERAPGSGGWAVVAFARAADVSKEHGGGS